MSSNGRSAISNSLARLYPVTLYLFAFSIPFPYLVSSIALGVLGFGWLCSGTLFRVPAQLLQRKMLWLWLLFYGLHLTGYYISTNKAQASFELVHKLGILVLPVIAGTGPALQQKHLRNVFYALIAGILSIACAAYIRSGILYARDHNILHFFYHELAGITDANAVYLAWYTLCCIFVLILLPNRLLGLPRRRQVMLLVLLELFFLSLSSRLLILVHVLLLVPAVLMMKNTHRHGRKSLLLVSATFTGIIMIIALTDNPISQRYKVILPSTENHTWLKEPGDQDSDQRFTNLTLRFFLWKTSLEAIKKHRLYYYGAGTGDVERYQEEQIHLYDTQLNEGNRQAKLWTYNIHNMYIQALYMLGLPGVLVLLLLIFAPLFFYPAGVFRPLFTCFTIISAIFMCIESALQTQAGILFFPFFAILFLNLYSSKSEQP